MLQKLKLGPDDIPRVILGLIAFSTVVILIGIFIFLFTAGIDAFRSISLVEFFTAKNWDPTSYNGPSWGTLSLTVSTLFIVIPSLLIAVPISISSAIYLSEIASSKVKEILKPVIEMIASIPTVVLGYIGLVYLAPFIADLFNLSNGLNALTAAILVAVATLPTITSICEDALSSIPNKLRESSFALGATRWQTVRSVVFPTAGPGIVTAIMLGFGRVIGETIIVLMVAGNSRAFPESILDPVRPLTATIAIEIKEVVNGSLHWHALFAIGFMLFLLTFVINLLAEKLLMKKHTQ